jgi:hypothetical protein
MPFRLGARQAWGLTKVMVRYQAYPLLLFRPPRILLLRRLKGSTWL